MSQSLKTLMHMMKIETEKRTEKLQSVGALIEVFLIVIVRLKEERLNLT